MDALSTMMGKKVHDIPGINVDVVETTGAGDAFHAGFVYGLLNSNMNLFEIGRFANACGGILLYWY